MPSTLIRYIMNDRRRLLVFSILILIAVSLSGVALTGYHVYFAAEELRIEASAAASGSPPAPAVVSDVYSRAFWLSIAKTLVVVIAGGTLLVRASNPFMRRLEQSEARLRAILNTAGDGIITIDADGRIESFNIASQRMFGYQESQVVGRDLAELIVLCAAEQQTTVAWLANVVALAAPSGQRIRGRRGDGTTFPSELSVSEVCREEQTTFTVIIRDITERCAAEEQMRLHVAMLQEVKEHLEAKAAELAKTNRELDDFTHVASHDLKEPLRGISSYCQILLEDYHDKLDDEGRRRLESLVGLCQRLGQLIDDLLTYSQIGRGHPNYQQVDLNAIVADVLQILGPAIDGRRGKVEVVGALPVVSADPMLVGELFRNLISNGLKFNESDCPTIEIGCLGSDPPTIFVRDNGIGIPAQHHQAVFTMFRRLHSRRKYDGTGAGLTFVRKIVESHGGRICLESEPGHGSTFFFTLAPSPAPTCSPETSELCPSDGLASEGQGLLAPATCA